MIINIQDDFDPDKIANCGQTFRALPVGDCWRFVTGEHILYLKEEEEKAFTVSCDAAEWNSIWVPYFDLENDYAQLRKKIRGGDSYTETVCELGKGIRILRQDKWEALATFIISQRKSIPAIRGCVEKICAAMGRQVRTDKEIISLFPRPERFLEAGPETLRDCGVGYRLPYLIDAAERVATGALDLDGIKELDDKELLEKLLTVKGVGVKVASCVALFGYGRMACAPVDVWIKRAINEFFDGRDPFESQAESAGLLQQYMFYYAQQLKKI